MSILKSYRETGKSGQLNCQTYKIKEREWHPHLDPMKKGNLLLRWWHFHWPISDHLIKTAQLDSLPWLIQPPSILLPTCLSVWTCHSLVCLMDHLDLDPPFASTVSSTPWVCNSALMLWFPTLRQQRKAQTRLVILALKRLPLHLYKLLPLRLLWNSLNSAVASSTPL